MLLIVKISSYIISVYRNEYYHELPSAWCGADPRTSDLLETHQHTRMTLTARACSVCQFTLSSIRHVHVFEFPTETQESCLPELAYKKVHKYGPCLKP